VSVYRIKLRVRHVFGVAFVPNAASKVRPMVQSYTVQRRLGRALARA
jgi:hypothetical protein